MTIAELKEKNIRADQDRPIIGAAGASGLRKQDLIFRSCRRKVKKKDTSSPKVFGDPPDATASSARRLQLPARPRRHLRVAFADPQVRLETGDTSATGAPAHEGEKYFALVKIEAVNFESPDEAATRSCSTT